MAKPRLDDPLTADYLRTVLDYHPKLGLFFWRWRDELPIWLNVRRNGTAAGHRPDKNGYIRIDINSRHYLAHRLAWLYVHGEWPQDQIDHINENPSDNRIANLRESPHGPNNVRSKPMKNNRSGAVGVFLKGKHWVATISHEKRRTHLGPFASIEEAKAARDRVAKQLRGAFHK